MRWTLGLKIAVLTIGAAPLAVRGEEKAAATAREVLLKSREAIGKSREVRYEADYRATGYIQRWVKDVRGNVLVGEKAKHDVPRFRLESTLPGGEGEEPIRVTVGCDGNDYYLVDEKSKTVYADVDPAVLGSNARTFQRLILREFGDAEAFKEELKSESLSLGEAESVGGVDCHVVIFKKDSPPDTWWWISKEDHLPRRVRRLYKDEQQGEGSTELTLMSLAANPTTKEESFRLRVPDGFKKTDEFAP